MFRNYLKTAFRNLKRQKGSSFINIAGLTLGITGSLILFLLVRHLSSFDNYHANRNRIYRVVQQSDGNGDKDYSPGVPAVLPDAFRQDFPEAEQVTFTSYRSDVLVTIPQTSGQPKKYHEDKGVVFAQSNFFKVFDRKIVIGNTTSGLDQPNEAIISKSLALKYFGKEDAINEIVKYDTLEYKITAVMEDYPSNTDFPFDLMLSYITIKKSAEKNGWHSTWSDEQCYFVLNKGERIEKIESRIPAFVTKYEGKENYNHQTYLIQPLSTLHSDDRFETYTYHTASNQMLMVLSIIAAFLIITACINFINLSTAEAIKRSKEVGIRKALGSTRGQLTFQFLGEATLITLFAVILSLGLSQLGLSFINPLLDLKLTLNFSDTFLIIYLVIITVVVSMLSGLYPSLIISGYNPVVALKNQHSHTSTSGFNLRRGLVVLQFVISQFLIIGTLVLISQMNYFQKKDLGFKTDAVVIFPIPVTEGAAKGNGVSKIRTLRNELERIPGIEVASLGSTPPSSGSVSNTGFVMEGEQDAQRKETQVKQVDGNYISLFDLTIIAGQGLSDGDTATAFIVNEEFAKIAGFKDVHDIIGRKARIWGMTFPVVGVVKNFHAVSLHQAIEPIAMFNRIRGYETLSVRINPATIEASLAAIKSKWEAAYPEHIYSYQFLDDHIREFYESEQKMYSLLIAFTSMAIFIGCLGLFGLATFMANQKTKEIGVRKVLGASVESIVVMFSSEFIKLIGVGFLIAAPLAWFAMNQYLNEFAYKIELGPGVFMIGAGITIFIALVTVSYKSIRAAIANPVDALRSE